MSEDISDSGKIPTNYFESCWSKFGDYFRLLQSRNRSKTCGRYVWWYIRHRKNSQKLFRVIFFYSLRLLSILARQKSTENKRKICLMIYQNREKFQKIIPNRLKQWRDYFWWKRFRSRSTSFERHVWWYIRFRKISKQLFRAIWSILRDYFWLLQSRSESTSCERYAWWYIDPGKNSKIIPSHFVHILRRL